MSARARIVGWMILVLAAVLGGAVLVTTQIVAARADVMATETLTHEAENFHSYAKGETKRAPISASKLLGRYLSDKVPDQGETFFSLVNGRPQQRSPVEPPARLDQDQQFLDHLSAADKPTSGWWDSAAGKVRYGVVPVNVAGDDARGALVIIEFRDVQAAPLFQAVWIFAAASLLAVLIAGISGWSIAGAVLEPVRLVRQTADSITESDLSQRIPVRGNDDVARLSETFNRMLDRLESTFDQQRDFVDNTSHELRTPIAVVRGHIELLGSEETPPDWQEIAETKEIVIDELDRMHRIVEDLLVLARSDRPDFLRIEPVSLADITLDVLTAVRVTADRQWTLDALAEDVVDADGQRIVQAVMQLVSNAVRFTDTGDRITVGSRCAGGVAEIWVDDAGRGVSPSDAPHIFERFHRGSAEKRSLGSGLGLSIVDSIARAHGGSVRLVDRPGRGARFVLAFPVAQPSGEHDSSGPGADPYDD